MEKKFEGKETTELCLYYTTIQKIKESVEAQRSLILASGLSNYSDREEYNKAKTNYERVSRIEKELQNEIIERFDKGDV